MADDVFDRALLDEALKKGALVWLQLRDRTHARWHAWSGTHVYLLTGAPEQPDPGLAGLDSVRIVVRSKDDAHRLLAFDADVSVVSSSDDDWPDATADLVKTRLNLADAQSAPERWAEGDVVIYRLTPRLPLIENPSERPIESHRAPPPPTPATTVTSRPTVLHRRGGSGRPLS